VLLANITMTTINTLRLDVLLNNINQLYPETVEHVTTADLRWILIDFLLSWGQRLPLDSADWPLPARRASLCNIALSVLPFSTAGDFVHVHPTQVRTLALAVTSLNLYVMLLDPVVDEPLETPAEAKLAIEPVLRHCYRLLSLLFPANSPFWNHFNRCMDLMSQTMKDEFERLNAPIQPFSWEEFKRIAHGKMTFAQINCIALAMLNATPQLIPDLITCWNAVSLASIVRDDALDWREDYCRKNYTYLLSKVLFAPPFREQVKAGQMPTDAEVGVMLFCTEALESFYEQAYTELTIAAHQAAHVDCQSLARLLRQLQEWMQPRSTGMFDRRMSFLINMIKCSPELLTEIRYSDKEEQP